MAENDQSSVLADFLVRHVKPYDPASDSYERPPFVADIKEGKNDPIYQTHSYHTKVPPRSIIPYILHYTQPGDVVLDLFCGSGMTGVAAQMCTQPPVDIIEQFPELENRVGQRACILNDLSPAACHIAYNYNTPVDVAALHREFTRIKEVVKDEFGWLYGAEHYEPAVGVYDVSNAEVASRLKNPPGGISRHNLLEEIERTWELLTKAEVEARLGYSVTELPPDAKWGALHVAKVKQWVCIPATIQFTIWSDIYRCEGIIAISESTGKVSTRGKNAGKPIVQVKRVSRGCGKEFAFYDVAMDKDTTKVLDEFNCPACRQDWTVDNLTLLRSDPVEVVYQFPSLRMRADKTFLLGKVRRKLSLLDKEKVKEITQSAIPYWYPKTPLIPGEQGNPFIKRGLLSVDQLYTSRNLRACARLWHEFDSVQDERVRKALQFLFTAVSARNLTRMTRYRYKGNEALAMRLFIPHLQAEINPLRALAGKFEDIVSYYSTNKFPPSFVFVSTGPAQEMQWLPDSSIDFIFADPPFGRNIAYAELNVLWESWLGKATDVPKEAITSNGRKWGVETYVGKMRGAFREAFRVLKPGRYALIEFNNGDPELGLFEHIKQAAIAAGFQITNMMILDKEHKSFNQVIGVMRGEDTVDKDVVFNLHKPASVLVVPLQQDLDLEHQVADAVRQHLMSLPARILAEPTKYSDEHRTTSTINSMLMNALIPQGVRVESLTLPFIERVCTRYFRKVGQQWYLRGEAVGGGNRKGLVSEEIVIKGEVSAIDWLRQKLSAQPMLIGELKPLWMKATGLLPAAESQLLVMEELLIENFWRDAESNRWREPTDAEREMMNDDRSLRVLHDSERFLAKTLTRKTSDIERCEWIDVLFQACRSIDEKQADALPALRGFDADKAYQLITQLFQSVLKDHVPADAYSRAVKQKNAASSRIANRIEIDKRATPGKQKDDGQTTLPFGGDK